MYVATFLSSIFSRVDGGGYAVAIMACGPVVPLGQRAEVSQLTAHEDERCRPSSSDGGSWSVFVSVGRLAERTEQTESDGVDFTDGTEGSVSSPYVFAGTEGSVSAGVLGFLLSIVSSSSAVWCQSRNNVDHCQSYGDALYAVVASQDSRKVLWRTGVSMEKQVLPTRFDVSWWGGKGLAISMNRVHPLNEPRTNLTRVKNSGLPTSSSTMCSWWLLGNWSHDLYMQYWLGRAGSLYGGLIWWCSRHMLQPVAKPGSSMPLPPYQTKRLSSSLVAGASHAA